VSEANVPNPQSWWATATAPRRFDVTKWGRHDRDQLLNKHKKTKADIVHQDGRDILPVQTVQRFIHNGDEFVTVATDVGIVSVRWSSVVAYFPAQGSAEGA
jgi:hypothetical protein